MTQPMRAAPVSNVETVRQNLAEVERELANPIGITEDHRQQLLAAAHAYRRLLRLETNL